MELYPGQAYFHEHNANIRATEERWLKSNYLRMPPIPPEILRWVETMSRIAQKLSSQ